MILVTLEKKKEKEMVYIHVFTLHSDYIYIL